MSIILVSAVEVCLADQVNDKSPSVSISFGAEAASGKYGADSTTSSLYMPLIVTWFPTERIDIGIEIPFIYQSKSNVTTHQYQNTLATASAKTVSRGGGGMGSVFGLGDILLRFGLISTFESGPWPQLRPSLYVKFPTSVPDGLGTGEIDAGAGIELTKWYGDLHLLGEGFYNYQGKVAGSGLKDYFSYTAGVGYQLLDNVRPSLLLKGTSEPASNSDGLLEGRIRLLWSITGATTVDLFASRGLSDSSPDYAGGIAFIYSF